MSSGSIQQVSDIMSMTLDELSRAVGELSQPKFRAGQIYSWLHLKRVSSFDEMTNLPADFRRALSERYVIRSCEVVRRLVSVDGTQKYLFRLIDGELIESVLLKYKYGYTLCISSQVGCKMACSFCATGIGGFARNLTASEMLAQIYEASRVSEVRVSHVVLMGMGEPLDNFDNVMRFIALINDEKGYNIGIRNISLSTCGIVPRIYELMRLHSGLTLSVSLHAPNDRIRNAIMPISRRYSIEELLTACRDYAAETSRRISFEYAMIDGVNDTDECAAELARRLSDILCHVNLIPANHVDGAAANPSGRARVEQFASLLRSKGINATVRRTLGSDIDASCGQLRGKFSSETNRGS